MSSCANPAVEADALMTRRPKYDRSKACVKCKLNTGNIVIRHAVYCRECFLPLISIRFRRTLEPCINPTPDLHRRKGLKASGNLFIGFSGGLCSTVLLDIVYKTYLAPREHQDGDQNPNRGCPWPNVMVGHVDISGALAETTQAENLSGQIETVVKSYGMGFEYIPLKLEHAFDKEWWERVGGHELMGCTGLSVVEEDLFLKSLSSGTSSPSSSLRTFMASLPTQTAKTNAIQTLVRVLLLYTATSTKSSHLLLGTSLTSLSISLISSISQGGGYSVKQESEEEWIANNHGREPQTVRIIRPLRDVGVKECAYWARWCQLEIVGKTRHSGGRQDITALTRDFITGLERDFPSTVSTIARTCNKLTARGDTVASCLFCERPAQAGAHQWKSKTSIRSYHELGPEALPPHVGALESDEPSSDHPGLLARHLCYACHTTWISKSIRGNPIDPVEVPVPVWIGAHSEGGRDVVRDTMRNNMRKIVKDYLLDPSS